MDAKSAEVVVFENGYRVLVAKEDIAKGAFIGDFWGPTVPSPTKYTHQIGINKHIDHLGMIRFGDHSCSPNTKLEYFQRKGAINGANVKSGDEISWHIVAARDISKGEQITGDYTLTEYSMASPFDCQCGSENCLGTVQGFKHLPTEEKKKRMNKVSPVIKELYEKA
jgi:hypothetical protein